MKNISIDIETYCSVDLVKCGVYKYVESEDFEILLFAYSIDKEEVKVVDMAGGEEIPIEVLLALYDEEVYKWAFNANFERICLSKYLGKYLSPKSWRCTMVYSATLGLPLSLEGVGQVLNLKQQKLKEGRDLIKYFCKPCEPNKFNKYKNRNLPKDDKKKWANFKEYNKRDVQVEMEIENKLDKFPVKKEEWHNYEIDQIINDRGIMLDVDFVRSAIFCDEKYKNEITKKAKELTKIENPYSPTQLKKWLESQGVKVNSLSKVSVEKLLEEESGIVKEVLYLRKELSKSSVKKYHVMERVVCEDNRSRGLIQFYGGSKTGRYAGRLIQVQNLPQNHMKDLEIARDIVKYGNWETLNIHYDSVGSVLSQLIRTAFVPRRGCKFIVADFSAIEARVLAWFAGEVWKIDVFEKGGDIYCECASRMFNMIVEKDGINSHLRDKGKIAELALGYGGSVGALKAMGAVDMGIEEEELQNIVDAWRNTNTKITKLWWEIDKAVKNVIKSKNPTIIYGSSIFYEDNLLFISLPSGRKLCYRNAQIGRNKFGKECMVYEGISSNKKWTKIETYGPKLVENIVQGIARDLLANAMKNLNKRGFHIVMHVHDEVVVEVEQKVEGKRNLVKEVEDIMAIAPFWAKDLVLSSKAYECDFYKKN